MILRSVLLTATILMVEFLVVLAKVLSVAAKRTKLLQLGELFRRIPVAFRLSTSPPTLYHSGFNAEFGGMNRVYTGRIAGLSNAIHCEPVNATSRYLQQASIAPNPAVYDATMAIPLVAKSAGMLVLSVALP